MAIHDANANLVRELHVPSDANGIAIQEALMKLFNAQVQGQVRDQTVSDAIEGQAIRAQSSVSDQALKASESVRDQSSSVQFSSVQYSQRQSPRPQDQFSSRPMYQYQAAIVQAAVIVH